jgi:phosphate uptake regulator
MKRKINLVGQNTLTVSLPSKWAKQHNLNKGDEIDLIEENNQLVLHTPNFISEDKSCTIHAKLPKRYISRQIFSAFMKGYDVLKIKYDEPSVINLLHSYVNGMVGFDITEQKKDFCIIKKIAHIDESEFESLFRRLFLLTITLANGCLGAIKKGEYHLLKDIAKLEYTQNKVYLTCLRIINKKGHYFFKDPNLYYLLCQRLEDIGDDYKYISLYLAENHLTFKSSSPTLKYFEEINKMLEKFYDFFYKFDKKDGMYIINKKKELIISGLSMLETVPKKEIRIIHKLLELLVKIYDAAGDPVFGINLKVEDSF